MNFYPHYPVQPPFYTAPILTSSATIISLTTGILTLGVVFRPGGSGPGYVNIAVSLMGICLFVLMFAGFLTIRVCPLPFTNHINLGH